MRQAFHAKTQKVRGREAKVTGSVYRLESLSQPRFPCQCPLLLPVSAVSSGDEGAGRHQRRHSCRKGLRVRLQSLSHLENRRQGAQHVKKSVAHMFSQTDRRTERERGMPLARRLLSHHRLPSSLFRRKRGTEARETRIRASLSRFRWTDIYLVSHSPPVFLSSSSQPSLHPHLD